jgi:hypothetical protein
LLTSSANFPKTDIFNGGWDPDWEAEYYNWCIRSEFNGSELVFIVTDYWRIHHFLTFKTSNNCLQVLLTFQKQIYCAIQPSDFFY